jgi:hypothetical protein
MAFPSRPGAIVDAMAVSSPGNGPPCVSQEAENRLREDHRQCTYIPVLLLYVYAASPNTDSRNQSPRHPQHTAVRYSQSGGVTNDLQRSREYSCPFRQAKCLFRLSSGAHNPGPRHLCLVRPRRTGSSQQGEAHPPKCKVSGKLGARCDEGDVPKWNEFPIQTDTNCQLGCRNLPALTDRGRCKRDESLTLR